MANKKVEIALILKDKFSKELKEADSGFNKLVKTLGGLKGIIGGLVAAGGIYELVDFMKDATRAAMEQEKADNLLAAALKAYGDVTLQTLPYLKQLASSMQAVTTYGDEQIEAVEALFLRYKIAPEYMEKAIRATMDYARAIGKDLKTAALDMAKAAQGNLMMLQRYGVEISKEEFATRGFVAVLDAVEQKFKGAEAAYASTFAGSLTQIKNLFGDLKEQIGDAIIKSEGWTTTLGNLKNALIEIQDELINNQGAWADLSDTAADFVNQMVQGLPTVAKGISTLVSGVWDLLKVFGSFGGMVGAIFDRLVHRDLKGVKAVWEAWKEDIRAIGQETEKLNKQIEKLSENAKSALPAVSNISEQMQIINNKVNELTTIPVRTWAENEIKPTLDFIQIEGWDTIHSLRDEAIAAMDEVSFSFIEGFSNMKVAVEDLASTISTELVSALRQLVKGEKVDLGDVLLNVGENIFSSILRSIIPSFISSLFSSGTAAAEAGPLIDIMSTAGTMFFAKEGGVVQGFKPLISAFQEGGVVTRPTLALVGEGREKEYIIPESKFPKPEVTVVVHNANPDTYVEVFTKWSPTGKEKFYREVIKPAAMRSEL